MRRTIHSDPRREIRRNHRQTRSILPSNFQFTLEEKGQDVEVLRTSDGQRRQMVEVEDYSTVKSDIASERQRADDLQQQNIELRESLLELTEVVQDILDQI